MNNSQSENTDHKSEETQKTEPPNKDTDQSTKDEVSDSGSDASSVENEPKIEPKPKSNRRVVAPPGVYRGR